jgi:hypothetical protein
MAYVYKIHLASRQFSKPYLLKIYFFLFDLLSNADGIKTNKVALITKLKEHYPTYMDSARSHDANPVNLLLQP